MSGDLIKAKLKASGIHLCISAVVFLGILYLILVEWYPGVFFEAEGGWSGIKLMAAVDLVLGPSLTLIIFNHLKPKKEIMLDLSFVAIVQIGALVWGGLQVYSERPVALVLWENTFYTVTEDYYDKQDIGLRDLAGYSDEKPLIIYAETDHSVEQLKEITRLNDQKIPPYAQVHLYRPVKNNVNEVLSKQISDELMLKPFEQIIPNAEQHVFLGKAKYKDLFVYLDDEAKLVDIKIRP